MDREKLVKAIEAMMTECAIAAGEEPSSFIPHDAAEELFWWERGMGSRWVQRAMEKHAE